MLLKPQVMGLLGEAALAYLDQQPCFPGEKVIFVDCPKTGLQFFLRKMGDTLLIAFRGSDSLRDWLGNVRFWKKKVPYDNNSSSIRVHSGFIDAYKSEEVRNFIQGNVEKDVARIRVTGHSLGAAMAVLCAVDMQYNFPDRDIEVALFGCPRVGNKAFTRSYDKRVFKTLRVENGNDVVTKLPLALLGYRHVGARVAIGAARVAGAISLEAHRPKNYLSNLWRVKGG